jgi:hypothetical protein
MIMVSSACSRATSPTTRPGPDENLPAVSTLGTFQHVTCHHCTHHRHIIAEFQVGERCSTCVQAWSTCFGARNITLCTSKWACHGPLQKLHFPLQPDWTTPPSLTRLQHFMIVCFKGLKVDVESRAGCMSSLTQQVCTHATPLTS